MGQRLVLEEGTGRRLEVGAHRMPKKRRGGLVKSIQFAVQNVNTQLVLKYIIFFKTTFLFKNRCTKKSSKVCAHF